jgi:hypothetical protein
MPSTPMIAQTPGSGDVYALWVKGAHLLHNDGAWTANPNGDSTNKFIGNTGSQFPNGLYADPTPQTVTAGLTGPAAAVAAGAAGLVALRNRGSRAGRDGG